MHLTQCFLPGMLERGEGAIVNVASIAGKLGSPNSVAYTASKHGLVGFSRAISSEFRSRGVSSHVVCPSFAPSQLLDDLVSKAGGARPLFIATTSAREVGRACVRTVVADEAETLVNRVPVRPLLASYEAFPSLPRVVDRACPWLFEFNRRCGRLRGGASPPARVAVFGMGCFWAPQETFKMLPGVVRATAGYAAVDQAYLRSDDAPSYFSVCRGDGRTEAVEVEYDPDVVSYARLLQVFWQEHDASVVTPGKEDQYRSVIWPQSEAEAEMALADVQCAREAYEESGRAPPLTIVAPVPLAESENRRTAFTPAEGYHQDFWAKSRLKMVVLALSLALQASGQPAATVAGELGTYSVLGWWTFDNFGLMVAALPGR